MQERNWESAAGKATNALRPGEDEVAEYLSNYITEQGRVEPSDVEKRIRELVTET
ncbi:MAG: hypothetical protein ABSD41_00515 [Candidatus Bathyarchaeia archaeon]